MKENRVKNILRYTVFNDLLYKCTFIVAALGSASPFIHLMIAPFMKILLAWGAVVLLYKLCVHRRMYFSKYYFILGAFCVSYGITVLLNRNLNFGINAKAFMYMVVILSVIFSVDLSKSRELILRELKIIVLVFTITSFFLAAGSLYTYIFSLKGHVTYNGQWVYYGMFENRLWGLYNPNTGSAINTLTLLMVSGYWIFFRPECKGLKVFFVIDGLCHYFCLLLTNSRTALYTLIIGVGMLIFLAGQYYWQREKFDLKVLARQMIFTLIGCGIIFISIIPLRFGLSYVPGAVIYVNENIFGEGSAQKIEQEALERLEEVEERPGGMLTGRTELWKAGIKTFLEDPVFGVTRENITERVGANLADKYWENDLIRGGLHNIYLTVLVSSGIVGFILFMAFILMYVVKLVRYAFSSKARLQNGFAMCLMIISVVMLIMELFEARILYQVGIFYIIFWCIAGYVLYFTDKTDVSKK